MSIILLLVELLQMYILRRKYLELQNFVEFSGNLLAFIHYFHPASKWLSVVMAIFIYFKMLITLLVFRQFRKLISLILRCLQDMATFLALVPLMIFTFAVMNYVIHEEYTLEDEEGNEVTQLDRNRQAA